MATGGADHFTAVGTIPLVYCVHILQKKHVAVCCLVQEIKVNWATSPGSQNKMDTSS